MEVSQRITHMHLKTMAEQIACHHFGFLAAPGGFVGHEAASVDVADILPIKSGVFNQVCVARHFHREKGGDPNRFPLYNGWNPGWALSAAGRNPAGSVQQRLNEQDGSCDGGGLARPDRSRAGSGTSETRGSRSVVAVDSGRRESHVRLRRQGCLSFTHAAVGRNQMSSQTPVSFSAREMHNCLTAL